MTDILSELSKFFHDNLSTCSDIKDRYRLQLSKSTAHGAYCFALQLLCVNLMTSELEQLNRLWGEYEDAFNKLLKEVA